MQLNPLWDRDRVTAPRWRLYSILDEGGNCPVSGDLETLLQMPEHAAHAGAMVNLIEVIGHHEMGPKLYQNNSNVCHEAVKGQAIYSFRKGGLRLYWFYGDGQRIVICHSVIAKKVRKTPNSKQLIAFRDNYRESAAAKELHYIE